MSDLFFVINYTYLQTIVKDKEAKRANKKSRTGPVVACGMADYDSEKDTCFSDVFQRADEFMYENKKNLKSENIINSFQGMSEIKTPIPPERKRLLDGMFGSLLTVSGGGFLLLRIIITFRPVLWLSVWVLPVRRRLRTLFFLIGNSSEFPMRQNAPRDAQLADGKIASRFCSRAKVLLRSPQD